MNLFKLPRASPYYRTLYNCKQHYFLTSKIYENVRRGSKDNKLGCDYYNNCKCHSRIMQITFFIIIINLLIFCIYYVN